jgi:hypothetical protein
MLFCGVIGRRGHFFPNWYFFSNLKIKIGNGFGNFKSKIARHPSDDRQQVLHILHKNARREKDRGGVRSSLKETTRASDEADSSSDSATNDWKHWVALQGDDSKAAVDVAEVGKSLGILVNVDQVNRFSVLSKAGKGKQSTLVGSTEGGV